MNRRLRLVVIAMSLCWHGPAGAAGERLAVYTVNYPLQYFAQRIAGDRAAVVLPAPPDVDPAFWRPDAATIGQYQRADVILLNGAGYAKWVSRASLPLRKVVDTSAGLRDRYIETEGGVTHSHGRGGDHSHAGTAFTTWLDLSLAARQAGAVRDALSRLRPDQADAFTARYRDLERDLLALDARLEAIVARAPALPLLASHPVYQYLARRYALNLKSVLWEPHAMPAESEWLALATLQQEHPASWMLWEAQPAPAIAQRLQKLGIQSVVFAPCGNRPAGGDWLSVMADNVSNLQRVFDRGMGPRSPNVAPVPR